MNKNYIGHPLQVRGAEQYVLQNGKGDGMHFIYVRNGKGLEVWISTDRCADIARVSLNGKNLSYFSPCGYVAPSYYDNVAAGFLKSFSAGFMTTCGLGTVGQPCVDEGENLPLHGTIANTPAELKINDENEDGITLEFVIRDCIIFGTKLVMRRKFFISYTENTLTFSDRIVNEADVETPLMLLYHCNLGYPLLNKNAELKVPYDKMWARSDEAEKYISTALEMEEPQTAFVERCYFFELSEVNGICKSGLYNDIENIGLVMSFKKSELPCFTEWKMMGKTDYVLGLEPGNIHPCGRANARKDGILQFLQHDEVYNTSICFKFTDNKSVFDKEF